MRGLNGPEGGPGSSGSGTGRSNHGKSHMTYAPGATDRAMWSAIPNPESSEEIRERRRRAAADAAAAAQKRREDDNKAKAQAQAQAAEAARSKRRAEEAANERDVWERMRAGWFDFDDTVEAAASTGGRKEFGQDIQGKEASALTGIVGTVMCVASFLAVIYGMPGGGM